MTHVILTDLYGKQFRATPAQQEALESLSASRAGGIATVYGYKPSSGYVKGKEPVQDLQVLTRFSTERLYERKALALSDVTFSSVKADIAADPVLSALSDIELLQLFNDRKAMEVDSLATSLSGSREGAQREAHDRCYAKVADGIRVHFVTEKVDGLMQPVLTDGLPTVASIMVNVLELSKVVRVPGEYKVVKSGAPVLMGNIIKKQLNSRSVGFKALSLKEDNFERLVLARKSYLPEDVQGIHPDILNG